MTAVKSASVFDKKKQKILLVAAIATLAYWGTGLFIHDVYLFVLTGIIYELLWLPMLISLFVLPVLAFIFWVKQQFTFRSVYPLIILLMSSLILTLIFKK